MDYESHLCNIADVDHKSHWLGSLSIMQNIRECTVTLATELVRLYDELSEFEARCAFIRDAVAASGSITLEPASAGGLLLSGDCLKAEVASLKQKLDRIRMDIRAK